MGLDMQSLIRFKEDGLDRSYTNGKELVFNPKTKQLEEIYSGELTGCSSDLLKITADDAVMFGQKSKLVIDQRMLEDIIERGGLEFEDIQVWFEKIDNGDVYVLRSQYEKGYIKRCSGKYKIKEGSEVVCVDPRYFRPTEVDLLIGNPAKAKDKLKWKPKYDLQSLIDDMIDSDLKLIQKDKYLDDGGYRIMHYFE